MWVTNALLNNNPRDRWRPLSSLSDTVERGVDHSLADAAVEEEGPPAKKARNMQTVAVQVQHPMQKSVGQRIKDALETSRGNLLCCSPDGVDTNIAAAAAAAASSAHALGATQINTIRIIGQYLKDLGLEETVATLFAESGCRLEDSLAVRLREYVLAGEWDHALSIADKMAPFVTCQNLLHIRKKLFEEKFVDLLVKERVLEALSLLTVDFPSDPAFGDRRNFLATLLYVDPKTVDVCAKTGAHFTRRARNALVAEIQELLPTSVMLPSNRLEKLLTQSWKMQCHECYLHVRDDVELTPDYILEDHQCDWDEFPLFTSQVLSKHSDEVWCVQFSPCGRYLATGSKSGPVHVWKVLNATAVESYRELAVRKGCSVLTWSSDGVLLAISSSSGHQADIYIYDVCAGSIFCSIENKANDSTVMTFVPNSTPYRLVCADQVGHFKQYILSKDGAKTDGKFEGYRIRAVHCLQDGAVLAADTHNRVRSYRFNEDTDETLIEECSPISTFVVDKPENRILIDTKLHGLRLWDLRSRTLIRTFIGAPHQNFIIHSAFGGPKQSYIITGGVDEYVYVWNEISEKLIAKLSGHGARVNGVAWNPKLPMMISCSDDCTARVWGPISSTDKSCFRYK
ncbi:unnamed protein product [Gongylonema pulchrum]|uniref:LisH domain-containing protein n=1 Tax=Gongylonema pulchrum TaxID=637853 RepID=A0A183DZM6_9BILA|nr:unnamed protein product [Gongylonema pulchrum]